jgi:hypothetical protein
MTGSEDHWLEILDLFLKNICKIAIKEEESNLIERPRKKSVKISKG